MGEIVKHCVYCDEAIEEKSDEHIIYNALGGLITSDGICCINCNRKLSTSVDKEFTSMFNPIIGKFFTMGKSHNTKSKPSYTGIAFHKETHKIYNVIIKKGKVVDCLELKKEMKEKFKKDSLRELIVINSDFSLKNKTFREGISKIAFNYAIYSGVNVNVVKEFLIKRNGDKGGFEYEFSNPVIPFMPLNMFDGYWELERDFEPYHNLILFNQENYLWCYVDLFNTFQFYVLISTQYDVDTPIYNSYMQLLERKEVDCLDISIKDIKDAMILSTQYHVPMTYDFKKLEKDIKTAIHKKSNQINMREYITSKFDFGYGKKLFGFSNVQDFCFGLNSLKLYMDDNDDLITNTYKQVTIKNTDLSNSLLYSYPRELLQLMDTDQIKFIIYGHKKFARLNYWLNMRRNSP